MTRSGYESTAEPRSRRIRAGTPASRRAPSEAAGLQYPSQKLQALLLKALLLKVLRVHSLSLGLIQSPRWMQAVAMGRTSLARQDDRQRRHQRHHLRQQQHRNLRWNQRWNQQLKSRQARCHRSCCQWAQQSCRRRACALQALRALHGLHGLAQRRQRVNTRRRSPSLSPTAAALRGAPRGRRSPQG